MVVVGVGCGCGAGEVGLGVGARAPVEGVVQVRCALGTWATGGLTAEYTSSGGEGDLRVNGALLSHVVLALLESVDGGRWLWLGRGRCCR